MKGVKIHRGTLDVTKLTQQVVLHGYVAFVSSRPHQRQLAREICKRLEADGQEVREGEAVAPNCPMCIVDTTWHDFDKVRDAVIAEDKRWANEMH